MSIKSELLYTLEQQQGNYLSGEALARSLSCSRTAVWKAIEQLRAEGYPIEATTRRGYALSPSSDHLSKEALQSCLLSPIGEIFVEDSVSSTNTMLKQKVLKQPNLPHGSIFLANTQTDGHGRYKREFFSPPDTGLYCSILLRPSMTPNQGFLLTTCAAVAVCRAVETLYGVSLSIKWVNDLFLNGKKVGGILTEAVSDFESGNIDFVIVGIGLNLLYPKDGFPKDLEQKAGVIFPEKKPPKRNRLAAEILTELLQETEHPVLSPEYIRRSLVLNRKVTFTYGQTSQKVTILSILPNGSLLAEFEDGHQETLFYGEISL